MAIKDDYRVVTNGLVYRIEHKRKVWWFFDEWSDYRIFPGPMSHDTKEYAFKSLASHIKWLERINRPWSVVEEKESNSTVVVTMQCTSFEEKPNND